MRSVILLRSRPGRPRWQLTTRPRTAAVLGLLSLAAAAVQVALLSSPPPWYQLAVAGFWTVVGVAFLASAVGTGIRARRAAATPARPPVAAELFVPVPVVPARRRAEPAREAVGGGSTGGVDETADAAAGPEADRVVDTGAPTADLADAVQTAVNPVVTAVVPAAVGGSGSGLALAARLAATSPPRSAARIETPARAGAAPDEPTTRLQQGPGRSVESGTRNRHAVRAVLSAEFATRALEEESDRLQAGRPTPPDAIPLRDGRVRAADGHGGTTTSTRGAARRSGPKDAATPGTSGPRPRETPDEPASSAPTSHTRTTRPRTGHTPTSATGSTPTRTSHRRPRKRRGAETPAPPSRQPADAVPGPQEDPVPRQRQARERATPDAPGRTDPPTAAETARPRGGSAPPTPPSLPSVGPRTPRSFPGVDSRTPPALPSSGPRTPPSLPDLAPRERTPAARPVSALTFGSPTTADPAPSTADPAPTRRRADPRAPAPRDSSSADRPTRARPVDAGRHARVEANDRAGHDAPRAARHAAADGRR